MKADAIFYIIATFSVILTFGATLVLPIPESYRGLVTLPGLISLFGIIIEAWRDKRAHERSLELLIRQQDNSLAIASHMATVVFDRQVAFCEAYFEKAHNTLLELFTTGPKAIALEQAKELTRIRTRYSPWLSPQIESGLLPFEHALREIGVDAQLIETNLPQPDHSIFVHKMYEAFIKLSHITEPIGGDSPEEAITSIITHLRNVLGVAKLTNLRDQALNTATIRAESVPK
jgi:hypothetical protein